MSDETAPSARGIEHSRADALTGLWVLGWMLAGVAMLLHVGLFAIGVVGWEGWTWWVALALLLLLNVLTVTIKVIE